MKDKLESYLFVLVFIWMCLKETVLNTPWMLFVLGIIVATGFAYFVGII